MGMKYSPEEIASFGIGELGRSDKFAVTFSVKVLHLAHAPRHLHMPIMKDKTFQNNPPRHGVTREQNTSRLNYRLVLPWTFFVQMVQVDSRVSEAFRRVVPRGARVPDSWESVSWIGRKR
jgi:hypothetical protein